MTIKSRLDLTEIFCDVDDFYQSFEKHCRSIPQLSKIKTHELAGRIFEDEYDLALTVIEAVEARAQRG
ncbi:MAG: hypothetical protein QNJ55_06735 [Xenococcus sp. MO_188.B8]|nr:hypothetical protein [Xenococcus sp. MO_188.B8]